MEKIDFTLSDAQRLKGFQYVDIDLSIARVTPEKIELAGNTICVSSLAWDSRRVISSTKTVGKAVLTLNNARGNPLELSKGVAYNRLGEFSSLWISNTAQPNMMMRIITGIDLEYWPFASEISVLGGVPSASAVTAADVSIPATSQALVLAALGTRKSATISNLSSNASAVRLGDSNTGAARGNELLVAGSAVIEGTSAIYAYNPSGSPVVLAVSYDVQ